MSALFDIDQIPLACPDCGEGIEDADDVRPYGCVHCYVNDDCPGGCNELHDAPTADDIDSDGVWECPTYGETYAYTGPEWNLNRGTWTHVDRYTEHVRRDGWWYASYEDAGLYYCDYCEEYQDEDHYHDSDDEDNDVEREPDALPICIAHDCGSTVITHYHMITEATYCLDHYTLMARENRALIPTLELVAA